MKNLRAIAALLAVLLIFSGLAAAQQPTWTIAIYVHADHNLDVSSEIDMIEMAEVGSSSGFNIVVQWDRIGDGGVVRGVVQKGSLTVVQRLPELDSDDPKHLKDFLDWAFSNYKANRYGVIMWNHGGNWDGGFGGDETPDNPGSLDAITIGQILQNSMRQASIPKLEFLSYDTCLMGSVELLAEYANLTNLYIANPELDYGDGWDYAATFAYLKANPGVDMITFGKAEASHWQKHHQQPADLEYGAHGVYNLAAWGNLSRAIDALAKGLGSIPPNRLAAIRSKTLEYNRDTSDAKTLNEPRPYADIAHLAKLLLNEASVRAQAQAVIDAVQAVVVAKVTAKKTGNGQALSIWFPISADLVPDPAVVNSYTQFAFAKQTAWDEFMNTWLGFVKQGQTPPAVQAPQAPTEKNGNIEVAFKVEGENVNELVGFLSSIDDDGLFTVYGQVFYASGGAGEYAFEWDKRWWQLSDGKTQTFVSAFFSEPDDALMSFDARYQPPRGKAFPIVVVFDTETGEIVSTLDADGLSPTSITLQAGGRIRPLLTLYDPETDEYFLCDECGEALTIPAGGLKNLKLVYEPLDAGVYELALGGIDHFGNETLEFVEITLK